MIMGAIEEDAWYKGVWLTNIPQPLSLNVIESCSYGQLTGLTAGCVAGPPKGTAVYSSQQLKDMGYIGLYQVRRRSNKTLDTMKEDVLYKVTDDGGNDQIEVGDTIMKTPEAVFVNGNKWTLLLASIHTNGIKVIKLSEGA
jgi:hypothetical protein